MKRSGWKFVLGFSLTVLVLLILFTIFLWALYNSIGPLNASIVNGVGGDASVHKNTTFLEYICDDFIGSPLSYVYLVDATMLTISLIALISTKSRSSE